MVSIVSLGIGAHGAFVMEPAATYFRGMGYAVNLLCEDSFTLDSELEKIPDFMSAVADSDILFVSVHGDVSYFKHFDTLRKVFESSDTSVLIYGCEESVLTEYRRYFHGSDEDYRFLLTLKSIGGDDNQRSALAWCLNHFDGADLRVSSPVKPMAQGVYVPGIGGIPLAEGIARIGRQGKPVIGIFFVNAFFTKHNTDAIDVLYRSVEEVGAEPLAVFFCSYEDPLTESIGISRIVDEFLIKDGEPVVDAVINTNGFSMTLLAKPGCGEQVSTDNFFSRLGVPVLQAVNIMGTRKAWRENPFGLTPSEVAYCVSSPEFDGQIDAPPYCGTERTADGDYRQVPIEDRCHALAEMALGWARLRHMKESAKKVAILVYMYPPRQDLAAGGYGLDTPQSVTELLRAMRAAGYTLDWVPKDGDDLMCRMLAGVTNDDWWTTDTQVKKEMVGTVSKNTYLSWFAQLSETSRKAFLESWGPPPGDIHMSGDAQLLPGIMDGNIFIGFQPDRGKTSSGAYHDPRTAPPHQYLGFYRWLKYVWKADAIVHMGTHGTLEWLPGKSVALSEDCFPDIILAKIPNINPYIIDNPGEGMQSKRRQYAVTTTHMIPAMVRAGGYGDIERLVQLVQQYLRTRDTHNREHSDPVITEISGLCASIHMDSDLGLSFEGTEEEVSGNIDRLYDHLLEIKDALIKDGLHVLGEAPSGKRLCEIIYSLTRLPNGDIPSLREEVARALGYDPEFIFDGLSGSGDRAIDGEVLDRIDGEAYSLIEFAEGQGFDEGSVLAEVYRRFPLAGEGMGRVVGFICGPLVNSLRRMPEEISSVLLALDGRYVEPGPSGSPERGCATILPTGRNFYSIDPNGIPWRSSWKIGSEMAEMMVERYVRDNGVYPDTVGVVLWATDTMKTGGDDVAYVMRLMGLRPVWSEIDGRVKGLEVIPLSELNRPRIDVLMRISGLFRDTFPNLSELLDRGATMIAQLDEEDDSNRLAANVRRETVEALARGVPPDIARREACMRVFGDAPGQYGNGVSDAVFSGEWETVDDLADIFVSHGGYTYGTGLRGEYRPELFKRRLAHTDVTVKNHNSRAVDLLDMDDDFDSLGGFSAAVESVRGEKPESYMGDSSDPRRPKLRTAAEECRFVFRSRVDNPKWLAGLKEHGFAGAKELSKLFDYTMGWSATAGIVDDWMYGDLAERFVLDKDVREWVKDENPYAMMAMLARLQEAQDRGFWKASDEVKEELKRIYLDFEERIEEITDS